MMKMMMWAHLTLYGEIGRWIGLVRQPQTAASGGLKSFWVAPRERLNLDVTDTSRLLMCSDSMPNV